MILRIAHYIREREGIWYFLLLIYFLLVIAFLLLIYSLPDFVSAYIASKISNVFVLVFLFLPMIIVPFVDPALLKPEIDFMLSTPAYPRFVFFGRLLMHMSLFLVYVFLLYFLLSAILLNMIGVPPWPYLVLAVVLGMYASIISFFWHEIGAARPILAKMREVWIILVSIAVVLFLYLWLIYPSQAWNIFFSIATLIYVPLEEYYVNEVYTNAYGLLERLQPRPRPVAPKPMPRSLWQLARRTTMRNPIYLGVAFISAAAAAAYLLIVFLLHVDSQGLAVATGVSAFFLLASLWVSLSLDLSLERLWISFSADHYAYVKYRMAARLLASLLATLPWIAAYIAVWLLRYPPAAHAAALLVSASLTFPVLTWLIAALSGEPQIRKYGLVQRPVRYQSLLAFLPVVIVFLYLLLARFWHCMLILSAAFFYIALFTRLGRGLWDWLVDRLAEVGYV